MRSFNILAILLGVGALPALAAADLVPFTFAAVDQSDGSGGGYNGRTDTPVRGVMPGDTASMCLVMMDGASHTQSVNTSGEWDVTRGPTFSDLGANRNGGGHIMGAWDENVQGNSVYVTAVFKTTDGSQFMPVTAAVNGQPAYFWSWHFGVTNAVNFQSWVTSVTLNSAHLFFSDNGGQSFSSATDITGSLNSSWNPGRDPGELLASIGDGTNFMLLQYQITVVPAPAGLSALAATGSLLAFRRRR